MPQEYNLDFHTYNETNEVIYQASDIDVVIRYYWDSHGTLHDWHGPNGNFEDNVHADTIKIVEYKYEWSIGNDTERNQTSIWKLYINGEQVDVLDVIKYQKKKRLFITAIMGTG